MSIPEFIPLGTDPLSILSKQSPLPPPTRAPDSTVNKVMAAVTPLTGTVSYSSSSIAINRSAIPPSSSHPLPLPITQIVQKVANNPPAAEVKEKEEALPPNTPIPLAQGAVKQVWRKKDVPDKVFYTALNGNETAQKELMKEVETAQAIRKNLQKEVLFDFLARQIVPIVSKDSKAIGYLSTFESVEAMKKGIEALGKDPNQNIDRADLLKLTSYLNSNEGNTAVAKAMQRGQNLAIDIQVVKENEKINNLFTVETSKADGDLEKLIRQTDNYTARDVLEISSQVLYGMADLHKAGYVHGDSKPENGLYTKKNDKIHVKISDFGKAQALRPDQTVNHVGNTRFAPWENRLTQSGDVCSTGIQLIRIFEQRILDHKRKKEPKLRSLIAPQNRGMFKAANSKEGEGNKLREGFEVFVIESADFNAIEANYSKAQTIQARIAQGKNMVIAPSAEQLQRISKEKDRYIDAVTAGMKEMRFGNENAIAHLSHFLKWITDIDPRKRPTMEQAAAAFEEIKIMLEASITKETL